MLHDRSVVGFEHDLWRLNGLHLLNVVDKDGVILWALQPDLGGVMLDLHVLLVHDPCSDFMSGHTLVPRLLEGLLEVLDILLLLPNGSLLKPDKLHSLLGDLLAFDDFIIHSLRAITHTCPMSVHRILCVPHAYLSLIDD